MTTFPKVSPRPTVTSFIENCKLTYSVGTLTSPSVNMIRIRNELNDKINSLILIFETEARVLEI